MRAVERVAPAMAHAPDPHPNNPLAPLGLANGGTITHDPSEAEKIAATARPFGDRVIVRQEAAKDRVGLIFTPAATEVPPVGVIVSYGSGRCADGTLAQREFKVGDRVVFQRRPDSDLEYALDQLKIPKADHEILLMLRFEDIMMIIGPDEIIGAGRRYL